MNFYSDPFAEPQEEHEAQPDSDGGVAPKVEQHSEERYKESENNTLEEDQLAP
jgi:hypothetical protein